MGDRSKYQVNIDELERGAHVAPEALVDSLDAKQEPQPEARLPQPDRDWFAAMG